MESKIKSLSTLWWLLKLQYSTSRPFFAWNLLHSVYTGAAPLVNVYIGAKIIASVTEVAFQDGSETSVYLWLTAFLMYGITDHVIELINRLASLRFNQKIEVITNEKFYEKMYQLSQSQFDNQEFNTKIERAQSGLSQLQYLLNEISWTMSTTINFVASVVAIAVVSPVIGLVIIVVITPLALLRVKQNTAYEAMYKEIEPYERISSRSRWMLIDPNTMPEIRLINAFKELVGSWKVNLVKSQGMRFAVERKYIWIDAIAEFIPAVVNFIANIYIFRLLVAGTVGLDRFIFLRGILDQASRSASNFTGSLQRLHDLTINLQNYTEVHNAVPSIPNGKVKVKAPLTIDFKNVSFTYPGTDTKVLDDVSFAMFPGSKLALVGENGAGKTTIIKLLLRQYLPDTGSITVNGTDIAEVDQASYYAAISNLSQDFLVINHLTIKENLLMGVGRKVADSQIMKIAKLVSADGFIEKLPNKLDNRLDSSFDDGSGLSGGQLQRLGVARALLRGGDVMILDEPTSAIDAKAEYSIFKNIYKEHGNKTTLIVSHRFSTVRKADKIIVMENGKIIEYGSHKELVEYGGLYKEMFETQAEGYK